MTYFRTDTTAITLEVYAAASLLALVLLSEEGSDKAITAIPTASTKANFGPD